jgi:hypothetical protein
MKSFFLLISMVVFFLVPALVYATEENTPNISDSWLSEAIEHIKEEEYKPSLQESDYKGELFEKPKYHFANRANNLRAYFDENGMELLPRVITEENWNLKIKSIEVTCGNGDKKISGDLKVTLDGDNIRCEGDGIKIIYSNSESGIEQYVIVEEKNETEGIDFNIEMQNLDISQENDSFVLSSKENEIIFRINKIEDADGKEIFYSLSGNESKLTILLDSKDIFYPIKITTSITSNNSTIEDLSISPSAKVRGLSDSADWTTESNQADANFGYSVSSAGDVNSDGYSDVIVGADVYDNGQMDEGRVFVYHGSSSGLSASANWMAESDQALARFGYSVSSAGDVNGDGYSDVIVGADRYDNEETNEGRAYVYHGSSFGLSTSADWTAESNQEGAWFGWSVSSAGDVNGDGYSDVIVGANWYNSGETHEGVAFVYQGGPLGLSSTADWTAESNQGGAEFGYSVSSAGDVNGDGYSDVIVAAPGYGNGQTNEGRAYVYHGSSSGLSASYAWTAEPNQEFAYFGWSVSSAGDVNGDGYSDVIVGAPRYNNGQTNEGRAYVYHGSSSGLSASYAWTAESNQDSAYLGISVSSAGDVNGDGYSDVIVGAFYYDNGETDEGAAFVYHGRSSGLYTSANWTAEPNQAGANLGCSVSSAGDVNGDGFSDVIVGAPYYDNGQNNEGRAFVYHGNPYGLSWAADWTRTSNQADANFGYSVSGAGDVNGDGYSDVIVGAWRYDNGETNEGRAYVYHGSPTGISATANWTTESNQAGANLGCSVSSAGDVNGDGYSDVIVGAPHYNNGEASEGAAFVYHGSSSGLSAIANWTAESNQATALFGESVSSAGDVNGDGYSDVIVGAWRYDNGETNEGRAYVYHGSSSGLSAAADWSAESNQESAYFGRSVSQGGDVNGDGFSDVIVGAPYYDNGQMDEGGSFVYHGSFSGLSASANWSAESDQAGASFGGSVSTAGDVNGDGYSDVIVGAYLYDNEQADEGRVFVYHGSSGGLSTSANWTAESDQAEAQFGYSVSSAGDVNGDGYSDVIVGAPYYEYLRTNEGMTFAYHGSSFGLSDSSYWSPSPTQEEAHFGNSVSEAGDVNGDGYSDVIVGAPNYDQGEEYEGMASVFFGNKFANYNGFPVIPTQSTTDGSRHVQLGNATGSGGVQLNILGRTPGGRGKVKLQWEVKELGELFDGTSLSESGSWYDTDTNGIEISEDVTGLSEATAYHWRVRLKYNPVTYNDAVHSRWLSIGPNGWNETDFITTALSGIEDYTGSEGNIQLSVFPSISTNIFSIRFHISEEEAEKDISLKVYNKAGIMVKNLFTGKKPAGTHTITWNGNNNSDKALPNDVYFISLKKGKGENPVRKIVLLR